MNDEACMFLYGLESVLLDEVRRLNPSDVNNLLFA